MRSIALGRFHKIASGVLAVQLVLVAVIALGSRGDEPIKARPIVVGFDAAKVTRLAVFAGGGGGSGDAKPAVELAKRGAGWVVASSFDYPADKAKVDELLGAIAKLAAAEPIATQRARHGQLHVADGDYERKLVIGVDGGTDLTLFVGAPAGARDTAVRLGGDDRVWAASGTSPYAIGTEPRQWVDVKYVDVPRDQIAQVTIQRGGSTVALARPSAPAAAWTATVDGAPLAIGAGEELDAAMLEHVVGQATNLELAAPADPKRDASAPTATITIARDAPQPPASGSNARPPEPPAPLVIDVIADGDRYWVHDRRSARAVVVDKARLDDVVTVARDKLVKKKPATDPPRAGSAAPTE